MNCTGQIRFVILFPRLPLQRLIDGMIIKGVVQPAMPIGRNLGGLCVAIIDHPTALAAVIAVAVILGFEITVSRCILTDKDPATSDRETSANRGSVPPGEDGFQHFEQTIDYKVCDSANPTDGLAGL